jgi:glycosyltransferase involved in cell wall biosynthesis
MARYEGSCDADWFRDEFPEAGPGPILGVVAQLIERKGHRDLLRALPRIRGEFPGVRVLFLGRGPLREELERQCREQGLTEVVRFAGFREDLERILPCLDLVVHPAHMEGLGVALLQAAAAARPMVAAPVGGIPEIVQAGETGLTAPAGDSEALAEAVLALLRDPERARQLGRNARAHVRRHFSLEAMVAGNLAVYRRILGSEGTTTP